MNGLQVNPTNGFLEADNTRAFTADKKVELLRLMDEYIKEHRKWPDLGSLCELLLIHPITLDRHLQMDQKFREAFRSLTLAGKWKLESLMFDMSAKNPMYMFGWLRKHFPAEYNPEHKITVSHEGKAIDAISTGASDIIDGEIVVSPGETGVSVP